jgi:hypothetical protein
VHLLLLRYLSLLADNGDRLLTKAIVVLCAPVYELCGAALVRLADVCVVTAAL